MKSLKKEILKEYRRTKVVHPTYRQIADKLHCSVAYVFKVLKKSKGGGKNAL